MAVLFERVSRGAVLLAAALLLPGGVVYALSGVAENPSEIPAAAHKEKSPLPKGKSTVLAGAEVYRAQCAGCHGPAGTPLRKFPRLPVQPATLTDHDVQHHSDGDLYWIVTHGESAGMPAFADDLSDAQRWQVVAFVRRLGKDAPAYTAQLPPEKP